jgi:hypothetical protein
MAYRANYSVMPSDAQGLVNKINQLDTRMRSVFYLDVQKQARIIPANSRMVLLQLDYTRSWRIGERERRDVERRAAHRALGEAGLWADAVAVIHLPLR